MAPRKKRDREKINRREKRERKGKGEKRYQGEKAEDPIELASPLTLTDDGDDVQARSRNGEGSEFSRGLPVTYKNFAPSRSGLTSLLGNWGTQSRFPARSTPSRLRRRQIDSSTLPDRNSYAEKRNVTCERKSR